MPRTTQPNTADQETGQDAGKTMPARRKRRRWRRWLVLLVFIGIGVLIFCLPYFASTAVATRFIVARVDDRLPGALAVESMSLSWLGPCELKGALLKDPEGREVVRVKDVTLTAGVWRLATLTVRFQKLSVDAPQITLYVDEHGTTSLQRAIGAADKPADEGGPSPLPALTGELAITDGAVKIIRADGRVLTLSRIEGNLNVDEMSSIVGKLLIEADEVGALAAEIDIQHLSRDGRLQPLQASGKVSLSTPTDLALGGIGRFALTESHAEGTASLHLEARLGQGEARIDARATMAGLQVRHVNAAGVAPIDVQLSGQIYLTQASLRAQAKLDGDVGDGQVDLTYVWPEQATPFSADDMVSSALTGQFAKWPDVVVEAKSRVDLARLAQAVPALLGIQSDVVVTAGELDMEQVVLRGGDQPHAAGAIVLRNVSSRRDGRVSTWEPVSLNWDMRIEPGAGLRVEQVAMTSGFSRVAAKGSPSDLHAEFWSDLAKLHQQAAQVFEMSGLELAGVTSGKLDLKRAGQERIDLALAMEVEGLRYRSGERLLEIGRVLARKNGFFSVAGNKVTRLTIDEAAWDSDGRVVGTASGHAGIGDGGFSVEVAMPRVDLAYVAERLSGLGVSGAEGYTGEVALQAKVQRQSHDAPVLSDGTVTVRNSSLRGEPLLTEAASLAWSGFSVVPQENRFEIKSAELTGEPAHVSATAISIRTADERPVIEGKVEGHADLARCVAISSRIAGREEPPTIAGRLNLSAMSQSSADGARIAGDARIDGLVIGVGDKAVKENQLRLAVQAGLNSRQGTIAIDQFQVDSRVLAVKMAGKISDYAETRQLDLSGDYRVSWDAMTALMHELAPTTADTVVIAGASESRFTLTGTLNQPEVRPAFRDASATAEVGWASADLYGVQMGKALLAPVLRQGQLTLPPSTIAAVGGQIRMGGELDFRGPTPVLNLGRQLQVLENIRITPEMGRELLSRVNPVFGRMAKVEGTVSLMTENVQLPLGEEIKTGGSGKGRLDFQDLRVQPAGLMKTLLELGGLTSGEDYAVAVSGVDFHLRDGRLYYEKLTLTFPQGFDLLFHGSVGFDDTVDLAVSIPVRQALLGRLGVTGSSAEYARRLEKVRVELPIAGTRLQPKLDLSQVDLKPLIEEAARSAISQGADSLLQNLLGRQREPKAEPQADPPNQRRPLLPRLVAPVRPTSQPAAPAPQPSRVPLRRERR